MMPPIPDGWRTPGAFGWDLWVSNEPVATIYRSFGRWTGIYYGEEKPRREFASTPENSTSPRDVINQIEDYVTAPTGWGGVPDASDDHRLV